MSFRGLHSDVNVNKSIPKSLKSLLTTVISFLESPAFVSTSLKFVVFELFVGTFSLDNVE
jgi:hypothetical protein